MKEYSATEIIILVASASAIILVLDAIMNIS